MKVKITAQPVFHLPIPVETIKLLMQMAAHHYDSRCKSAGLLGGFLYGWNNMATLVEGETLQPMRASWDDIDITLKITENTAILWAGECHHADLQTIYALRDDLYAATAHWNRIREDWVTDFDTKPRPAPILTPLHA